MLKKLGFPTLALAAILTLFAPRASQAKVRIGFGPVVTYPVNPYAYSYAYPYAYAYPYGYGYGYPYNYYGPTYVAPFVFGFGGYGHHFHGGDWGRAGHFGGGHFQGGHFGGGHFGGGHFGGHGGRR